MFLYCMYGQCIVMGPQTMWGPGQFAPVAPLCRRPCMEELSPSLAVINNYQIANYTNA